MPFTGLITGLASSAAGHYVANHKRETVKVSDYSSPSAFLSGVDSTSGAAYKPNASDYVRAFAVNPTPQTAKSVINEVVGNISGSSDSSEGYEYIPTGRYRNPFEGTGIDPFGSSASSSPAETPQPYAFMDTSLASMFGMDPATHYQEALANTAHQRQVRDLQAAGLNPVLGISGNGASVFPGTYMPTSSGGSSYGSSGSGKSTSKLAGVAKTLSYSAPYLVGGVVGLATKNPYAAGLAQSATQTLVNLVKYN